MIYETPAGQARHLLVFNLLLIFLPPKTPQIVPVDIQPLLPICAVVFFHLFARAMTSPGLPPRGTAAVSFRGPRSGGVDDDRGRRRPEEGPTEAQSERISAQ
jgi:hypothetical protein